MKEIKTVAILGAGAMGAIYASRFVDSGQFTTVFVARGQRNERLKKSGCVVNGRQYLIPVVHPDEKNDPVDLIIVALKSYNLEEAVPDLKSLVGAHTTIISVMNGLDSEDYIGSVYGMDKILYAIAVGMDAVREGNSAIYTNPGKIIFGEANNSHTSERAVRLKEAFRTAGIASDVPPDMMRMMWWKFMINVGVNQASVVMRANYGVFQTSVDAQELMNGLMSEVISLAQHSGVNLTDQDLQEWNTVLNSLSPSGKTSMLQDIEAGRKTEVEAFAGKVVDMGKRYGVQTPVNRVLLNIIRVLEQTQSEF